MNSKLNDEKWISGLAPDSTVAAAARTSLQHRLQAVIDCLGWVAEGSNIDEQSIHLLRVWIRRSMAVLVLYRSVLPKKETRRVRRILKRIRRDAGATRDLDILLQRAATGGFGESTRFSGRLQRRRDEAL
ncbi:MAG: CHAD domain-containing protein, partial [Pirellula sp.]